ncbi:MAG: DUF362 domain-containing protein [Nitrospirota bacterium]
MDRRTFLKSAAIVGCGLLAGEQLRSLPPVEAAEQYDLVVAGGAGKKPAEITRAAIRAMGGMKKFVSRGDVVVVKPNIGWDRLPEHAANTNPEVVAAIVKLCFEAGAKKVKVFDRTCNDARRTYKQSGIADAVSALGAEVSFIDDRRFRDMSIKGRVLKTWPLYRDVFEADKLINVPVAKHHGLARLTMAMKNWMGIMGGNRGSIHQKIGESLADLCLVIRPTLTVLDAVRILTANGPQGGNLKDVKKLDTVVAGVDQVAVDSYGATLFGLKGSDLSYVKAGAAMGIGKMDLAKMKIRKLNV